MPSCAGLLNADDSNFTEKLLEQAAKRFDQALASADKHAPRLLMRFFAALVPANVVHPSSVLNSLCSIVDAALEAASAGEPSVNHAASTLHAWQEILLENRQLRFSHTI